MSDEQPEINREETSYIRHAERACLARFAYHFWRIDTAARAFPYNMEEHGDIMKERWEIGLILELEDFRLVMADVCMIGRMTTRLSCFICDRLQWANISAFPSVIIWDYLPRGDNPPPVPCLPWMFAPQSNYIRSQTHWWESPESEEHKPEWWKNPVKSRWLYQVRVPADLIGRYVADITDADDVLKNVSTLLESIQNEQNLDTYDFDY